ncbi:hypothetical protein J6590_094539 [Homalodisca vitripennis]|nr:hypothetical protein J6590_094539 [Homalodisca vitripennis]
MDYSDPRTYKIQWPNERYFCCMPHGEESQPQAGGWGLMRFVDPKWKAGLGQYITVTCTEHNHVYTTAGTCALRSRSGLCLRLRGL